MRQCGRRRLVMAAGTIRTRWFLLLLVAAVQEAEQEVAPEVAVVRAVVPGPPEGQAHLLRVRAPRVQPALLRAEPVVAEAVLQPHQRLRRIFFVPNRI